MNRLLFVGGTITLIVVGAFVAWVVMPTIEYNRNFLHGE